MSREDGAVIGTTGLAGNGPPQRRWNVVLLAEGFRASELPTFHAAVDRIATTLFTTPPFDAFRSGINVFGVDVASRESGADDPVACGGSGAMPRTFFDARYCATGGIQRALGVDNGLAWDVARSQVPQAHVVVVVVNSPIWGGLGGSVATCSLAPGAERVAIHELGHTYFGLGDEYDYFKGCGAETDRDRHGFTFFDLVEPNLTVHPDRDGLTAHKWGRAVAASTPVPTMRNPDCSQCDRRPSPVAAGTVGLFEGAHYYHCDAFRAEYSCMMRSTEAPFCRACRDQIVRRLQPFAPTVVIPEVGIFVKHTGKALDVSGMSRADGAPVIQWDWWAGTNQRWRLENLGDGTFRIVSVHSGKVLDVSGVSRDNGAPVIQWDWWGGANQKWRLEDAGDGFRRIVSVHSGKVLDVSGVSRNNGAPVIQWDWVGGDNQRWRLTGVV